MVIVRVPVKLYIKRFLENKCGQPCLMTREDDIGKYFYKLLEDTDHNYDTQCNINYRYVVFLGITEHVVLDHGSFLTPTDTRFFNTFMTDHIMRQSRQFITVAMRYDPKISFKKAVEDFQREIGVSNEEMPYETIKKDFERAKKKKDKALSQENQHIK